MSHDSAPTHRGDQASLAREQAEVVRFAYRLDAERRLTGQELSALAEQMVNAKNPTEVATLRETISKGFYGMIVCGEGALVKTFLASTQTPTGAEVR